MTTRRLLAAWRCMVTASMLSCMGATFTALAAVPVPMVSGPIPSDLASAERNHTFFATDLDLRARHYVEEEFFFEGTANVYDATIAGGIGARPVPSPTANVVSS